MLRAVLAALAALAMHEALAVGKTGLPDSQTDVIAVLLLAVPLALAPLAHRLMRE